MTARCCLRLPCRLLHNFPSVCNVDFCLRCWLHTRELNRWLLACVSALDNFTCYCGGCCYLLACLAVAHVWRDVIHVVYITFISFKPFLCVIVNSCKLGFILYSPLCDAQQLTVCFCCKSLWFFFIIIMLTYFLPDWQDTRFIFLFHHFSFSLTGSHGANCGWQVCRGIKAHCTDSGAHTSHPGSTPTSPCITDLPSSMPDSAL